MAKKPDCDQPKAINKQEEANDDGLADSMRALSETEMILTGMMDKKTVPELENIDQSVIDNIYKHCTDLNILVAGITGSGKSSLANAIHGSDDAFDEGNKLDHCTANVTPQKGKAMKQLRVWDSPGLLDGTNCDKKYLNEIETVLKKFEPGDLILFCIKTDARFPKGEINPNIKAMLMLRKRFGDRFSKNLVIVLTHADQIIHRANGEEPKKYYKEIIEEYRKKIREVLKDGLKLDVDRIKKIPIIPVQHHNNQEYSDGKKIFKNTLPDGTLWLSALWFGCLQTIPNNLNKAKWIEVLQHRIVNTADPDTEKARHQLVLSDEFLPEKLLEYRYKYKVKGGLLGLLGGPLMLITISLGIWQGGQYGEGQYRCELRDLQMQDIELKKQTGK